MSETTTVQKTASPTEVMTVINQSPALSISTLDFVKEKFVRNYELSHPGGRDLAEMIYHRQMVNMNQALAASTTLQNCDKFSIYACFVTAAVKGYSLDPKDGHVYLIPRGGKACLDVQAPGMIQRLIITKQIKGADQAKLVYRGDEFLVENGRVVKHVEAFGSEEIIAAYVRFILSEDGTDRYFIYRKSDWEAWRKKSPQKDGELWNTNGQPNAAFLRTKIIKHAASEKCWSAGSSPLTETYNVEITDGEENDQAPATTTTSTPSPAAKAAISAMTSEQPAETVTVTSEHSHNDDPFA